MLKNLKRKFVITNMVLVGIVLLVVFIFICTNTYNSQMREIRRTLKQPISSIENNEGKLGYMTSVIVITDEDANIYQTYVRGASMEEELLTSAVEDAVDSNNSSGRIGSLSLFYEKKSFNDDKIIIVFVDASRMDEIVWSTVVTSGITFIIAMVIVYFISMFMASFAIKPVQKSWEQQKRFVADASHELKTPLTVILANNEILRGKRDKTIAEEKQWIDSTIDEAKHMKKLVEDMLFLAKNDSADIKVERTEVNISDLAEGDMLQFEPVAYEAGVMLDSKIDNDFKLIADGTQMKQLLHILIDNAIKYATSEKQPKVQLEIRNNGKKEIIVRNTCKVVPKNQIDHLFNRFYRGDEARTRVEVDTDGAGYGLGGGYGLGLAIAKTIVENHHGTIIAKSDMTSGPDGSEGIEFRVTFK